jgi:hypothetical protein
MSTRGTFWTGVLQTTIALSYTLSLAVAIKFGSVLYLVCRAALLRLDNGNTFAHYVAAFGLRSFFVLDAVAPEPGFPVRDNFILELVKSCVLGVTEGCLHSSIDPWYAQPFPSWTRYISVPLFGIILSMVHFQQLFSAQTFFMALISCNAYILHDLLRDIVTLPELASSALRSFAAALGLAFFYTVAIARTEGHRVITHNVSIPGIMLLIFLGISSNGDITRGIGLDLVLNMFLVVHAVTLGVFVGEAIVTTSGDEDDLIDALEEAEEELRGGNSSRMGMM